jgi:uncharacterized protein (DUF488 family)
MRPSIHEQPLVYAEAVQSQNPFVMAKRSKPRSAPTKQGAKPASRRPSTGTIWTVGHSTRTIQQLLELLAAGGVKLLADVRRFPGSRRHPQFNQDALAASLSQAGIEYRHLVDLGGRRSERLPDSPNTAWRVESFNAYADHMQSAAFQAALEEVIQAARKSPTAIMCSEALPQQCHRRLIADALVIRGWIVRHLLTPRRIEDHQLTPFARVNETVVTYPAETLF